VIHTQNKERSILLMTMVDILKENKEDGEEGGFQEAEFV
jgi:hypothetical protein